LWNPEFGKLFFVESGILGFGTRNKAQGIRNPLCIGIGNPSCSGLRGNPESRTWSPESKAVVDSLTRGDIKQVSLNNTKAKILVAKMPA